MKKHPSHIEGERDLSGKASLTDFVDETIQAVHADRDAMQSWLDRKAEFYERRFGLRYRNVTFPWVGASDIVLPLMDTSVREANGPLLSLLFGGPRIYHMLPYNAEAIPRASAANRAMQYLLTCRMRDYKEQKAFAIESLNQYGSYVNKVYYSYVTRQTPQTVRRVDLPGPLAGMAVFEELTDLQRQAGAQIGATWMTRAEFSDQSKDIAKLVKSLYGLDDDDPVDKVCLSRLMEFLRDGSKDSQLVLKRRAVVEDCPRLINVPLENLIIPRGTRSIDTAERIVERMYFTESDLRQRARDAVWNDKGVDLALEASESGDVAVGRSGTDYDALYQAKIERENQNSDETADKRTNLHEIWEVYTHWDIDSDGLAERVVLTIEPRSKAILKAIELPFDHGEWPYVSCFAETIDNSYFAPRGNPELIDDLDRHAMAYARAMENSLAIQTSQSFTYLNGSGIDPGKIQWMPNLMIPVDTHDALQPIPMAPTALALERPMLQLLSMAERAVGGFNPSALQDERLLEPRTKAEVEQRERSRQRALSVKALLLVEAQKREGKLLWANWRQYGPDDFYALVAGEEPVKLTQAQIAGDYDIVPVAAIGENDPSVRAQKALSRLDIGVKMLPLLADDPQYEVDIAQLYVDYLEEDDLAAARRAIKRRSPEEVQQLLAQRQQIAQEAMALATAADRMVKNEPISQAAGEAILKEIRSISPHKDLQRIIATGRNAVRGGERATKLAGSR